MTIVIFIIILAVLILVHEAGHFLAAKSAGVRVDEFGLGFPPAIVKWRRGETTYSLNLIPFGGFVKIFGENPDEAALTGPDRARSLVHKSKLTQAWVLFAGVFFNFLLAWALFTTGFISGLPISASEAAGLTVTSPAKLLITSVLPDSPAEQAGLKAGDEIVGLGLAGSPNILIPQLTPESVRQFVAEHSAVELEMRTRVGEMAKQTRVTPTTGLATDRPAIGISMDEVVIARASPPLALWRGLKLTGDLTWATARALGDFALAAVRGQSSLATITGPVGLVGLVGDARSLGWIYLLNFTALISINLAIINLVPFPALDGGRLLFLLIEKIKGSAIKPVIANWFNLVGFVLLLGLMALVTVSDIFKLAS